MVMDRRRTIWALAGMTALEALALANITYAQISLPAGAMTKSAGSSLKTVFDILSSPWIILFIFFALGWSLFYMMYRLGLEKSNSVPHNYQSKLATILAFISVTPLLYWYSQYKDAAVVVKAILQGWPGFTITLIGGLGVMALTYYLLAGWSRPSGGGP